MLFQKLEKGALKLCAYFFAWAYFPLLLPVWAPFCLLGELASVSSGRPFLPVPASISLLLWVQSVLNPGSHGEPACCATAPPSGRDRCYLTPRSSSHTRLCAWLVLRQCPGWAHSLEQGSGSALGTKGRNPGCVARCTHQTLPCGSSVTTSCVGPPGS